MPKPILRIGLLLLLIAGPAVALEKPPRIAAQAWALVDATSGAVLAEHGARRRLPPASLTKLMTAYLVFERLRAGSLTLEERVRVSPEAARTRGSRVPLRAGDEVTVEALIKSMLLRSANNATVALAEHIAGSEARFVDAMNARARAWGLVETHFVNSTGLDRPGHLSSARDLTRIALALIRDFPDYYGWFSLREFDFNDHIVRNSNPLLYADAADGIKTGYTRNAGWCLIASAERAPMRLIATVLGAPGRRARVNASRALLDYGFRNFETQLVYRAHAPAAEARVWLGEAVTVPLGVAQDLYVTLPRGRHASLEKLVAVADAPYAPVHLGQPLGSLRLALDGEVYGEYPLVALKDVAVGGAVQQAIDNWRLLMQ